MRKVILTSDIDWAPEEVIQDFLDLLQSFKAKCTLFCTHQSQVISNSDSKLFEKAIHPNFNPSLMEGVPIGAEETLNKILSIYPDAVGVRSHSMTSSTPLQVLFNEKGLKYDSNLFLPYKWNVKPFKSWTGLTTIPYHWEDDIHFSYGKNFEKIPFEKNKEFELMIFDFHPIHVFLNTDCEQTYLFAKKDYHDYNKLKTHVNNSRAGTRDFLIKLLKSCSSSNDTSFFLMKDLILND